jgi:membrane protein
MRVDETRDVRRGLRAELAETFRNWNLHGASTQSAALAFYTIFSLAPILVVVIAVAGALFGADAVRGQIYREFRGVMGAETASFVQGVLQSAARHGSGLAAVVGTATLLVGASAVFVQLQESLNVVWAVAPHPGAAFTTLLKKRLLSFALVLGLGFLLVVSLVLSAALTAFGGLVERRFALPANLLTVANGVISYLLVMLLFAMVYRVLPDVRLSWREVWTGGAVTAFLVAAGKALIGLYLGHSTTASTYGAAGSLVVILLWVYYTSLVFLFGAELTRVHSRRHRSAPAQPEEGAVRVPEGTVAVTGPGSTAALAPAPGAPPLGTVPRPTPVSSPAPKPAPKPTDVAGARGR